MRCAGSAATARAGAAAAQRSRPPAIRTEWQRLGWTESYLGYPITDERVMPDERGRFNHFRRPEAVDSAEYGSIYWRSDLGAHPVHWRVRKLWAGEGWELGW